MKNRLIILSLFFITSCGFASGLYKDILIAQDYISSQRFNDAVELYESILIKKPSKQIEIKIHFQLGELYSLYLQKYQKSLFHFTQIIEITEDPLWVVKATEKIGAINFENDKNYKEALKYYKKLIDFKPELENINFYRYRYADSYLNMKDYETADKLLLELIKTANDEYAILAIYNLGLSLFYQKKIEGAVNYWYEYLKREKRKDKIVQAKFMIANAYESTEKLKEAYNIYYSILGDYPNPEVIKKRLDLIYKRRISRKR